MKPTPVNTAALRCHFCQKSNDEVRLLIAGPYAYICNECVVGCVEVLAGRALSTPPAAPAESLEE